MPDHPRASHIAEMFLNGNLADARNAVLADPRPDLMALDVLVDLLDQAPEPDGRDDDWDEPAQRTVDRWRRCLAGGL